jgi:Protein of unknown function (DUF1353)
MELISDGKPLYLPSETGKTFKLIEDWKFRHDALLDTILLVPQGYKSDLASIPSWVFWWQWGKWNIAAIAHDYIYEHGYLLAELENCDPLLENSVEQIHLTKQEADLLFYDLLKFLGVRPITARLMYWAVKLFGRGCWET